MIALGLGRGHNRLHNIKCRDNVSHGATPAMLAMTIITAMSALKGSAQTSFIAATSATRTALQRTVEWLEDSTQFTYADSGLHAHVS